MWSDRDTIFIMQAYPSPHKYRVQSVLRMQYYYTDYKLNTALKSIV